MIDYDFKINNESHEEFQPTELETLEINAAYDNFAAQPSITTSDLTFAGKGLEVIKKYLKGGLDGSSYGAFYGLPYDIILKESVKSFNAFHGILDFSAPSLLFNDTTVKCKLKSQDGLNRLSDRAKAMSYGYLLENQVNGQWLIDPNGKDFIMIPYVRNYIPDYLQSVMLSISIFMIEKEAKQIAKDLYNATKDIITSAIPSSGLGIVVNVGAILGAALRMAALIIYMGALVVALIKFINSLISSLYSPVLFHSGMSIQKCIEVACKYLGIGTISSSLFTNSDMTVNPTGQASIWAGLVYLPPKTHKGQSSSKYQANPNTKTLIYEIFNGVNASLDTHAGCPNSLGYGYSLYDMFELIMKLTNSKILIKTSPVDGSQTLYLEPLQNITFWQSQSSYTIPDVTKDDKENITYSYNTSELIGSFLLEFNTDGQDFNTTDNFYGTNIERLINLINPGNSNSCTTPQNVLQNVLIKGVEEVKFNVALGTRKEGLTVIETILKDLLSAVDTIIQILSFGAIKPNFAGSFTNRVGMLNLQNDFFGVPKVLLLGSDFKIIQNDRQYLSAQGIYSNFYQITSFVNMKDPATGKNVEWIGQYKTFKDYMIPFSFADFLNMITCGWCYYIDPSDNLTKQAKIDKLTWNFTDIVAKIDFRVRECYTKNLSETFVIPS